MIEHVHIKVTGRVQRVGFRICTQKLALKYNIVGTVTNKEDGTVEIYAQGETKQLQIFITNILQGASPFSKVIQHHINHIPLTTYKQFKII